MGVGADPDVGSVINTFSSTVANGNFGFPINTFPPIGATKGLDQPWIETGPSNHVYIGYNNTSSATPGETASILVSSDGGNNYNSFTLDRAPSALGDDPSVREAVNGNTVYAVFDRLTKVSKTMRTGCALIHSLWLSSRRMPGLTASPPWGRMGTVFKWQPPLFRSPARPLACRTPTQIRP